MYMKSDNAAGSEGLARLLRVCSVQWSRDTNIWTSLSLFCQVELDSHEARL